MKIKEIMNSKVRVVPEEMHLIEALSRMKHNNTGVMLVKNDHHIYGILSAKDVLMRHGIHKDKLRKLKVRDVMNPNIRFVYDDQSVQLVKTVMKEKKMSHLIVLDRNNKIRGICARKDVGLKS
ncbi:CBS domain-containing protein [bacterium]|nr:CBS domain-containing protein [bacterium]